jgi:hypothetical protein
LKVISSLGGVSIELWPTVLSIARSKRGAKMPVEKALFLIALGRLSPAKAADTFFTLIRPEFYRPDSQSHLVAQSAIGAVVGSASACLRPLESAEKFGAIFKQCQQIGQKRILCIN